MCIFLSAAQVLRMSSSSFMCHAYPQNVITVRGILDDVDAAPRLIIACGPPAVWFPAGWVALAALDECGHRHVLQRPVTNEESSMYARGSLSAWSAWLHLQDMVLWLRSVLLADAHILQQLVLTRMR